MKMKIKSIFLSMLAVAGLASCSSDNDNIPSGGAEGEKAYVSITLDVAGTRTTAAQSGDSDAEFPVKNATLFIFKSGMLEAKKDFGTITENKSEVLTTTKGLKDLYVVANAKDDETLNGITEADINNGITISDFEAMVTGIEIDAYEDGKRVKDVTAKTGAFIMSGIKNALTSS